jgi:hypothetical protein
MQALANSFTSSFNSELNGDTRDADGFISDFIERLRGYFSYSNGVLRRYYLLTAYFYHVELIILNLYMLQAYVFLLLLLLLL